MFLPQIQNGGASWSKLEPFSMKTPLPDRCDEQDLNFR
jgi:hypothetical protein